MDPWNIINNDAKEKGMKFEQPSFYNNMMGFYHAVDWKEQWIQGILCFHVLYLIVSFLTRKSPTIQFTLLITICIFIYFAETFNSYGSRNWTRFSTQDYFDPNGVFLSVVFSTPLLLIGVCIMLHALYDTSQMLVKVKRLELGIDKRGRKNNNTEEENVNNNNTNNNKDNKKSKPRRRNRSRGSNKKNN